MKTIYDSSPEFSMTYTHIGIQVTFSAKVIAADYPRSSDSEQENEQQIGSLCETALQSVAQQVASQLTKFHCEFDKALWMSLLGQIRSRHSPPGTDEIKETNSITKTEDANK